MRKYIQKNIKLSSEEMTSIFSGILRLNASSIEYDPADVLLHYLLGINTISVHPVMRYVLDVLNLTNDDSPIKVKFISVTSLNSCTFVNTREDLMLFKSLFPDIKSLQANVGRNCIQLIRKYWPYLEELYFPSDVRISYANDDLSTLFFNGQTLVQIENMFIEDNHPVISFKNLRRLSMGMSPKNNNVFLSMLLQYYPNLDFQCEQVTEDKCVLTAFSGYICHNVSLNPHLKLSHCDIRVEDLKFNFIEATLRSWINLESICFIITSIGNLLSLKCIASKLKSILDGCKNLNSLQIMNVTDTNVKYILSLLPKCLKKAGLQILRMSFVDLYHQTRIDDVISLINCCPKLTHLSMKGNWNILDSSDKCKFAHKFDFLTHFSYLPMSSKENVLRVATGFVMDIIKVATELKFLETHMMMVGSCRVNFPEKLKVWSLFELDQNCECSFSLLNEILDVYEVKVVVIKEEIKYSSADLYELNARGKCNTLDVCVLMSSLTCILGRICERSSITVLAKDMVIDRQFFNKWNSDYGAALL